MTDLLAPAALLPDGWARDVLLSVGADGALEAVASGWRADAGGAPPPTRLPGIVVPGVPNAHSHAFQRGLAGRLEQTGPRGTFWSWRERMYAFAARLRPEDVEALAAHLFVEMLEAGYTAVAEFHYLHHAPDGRPYEDVAEMTRRVLAAADVAGIGLTHLPVLYMAGDFGGAPPEAGQRRFLLDPDGLAGLLDATTSAIGSGADRAVGVALHSLRAVPPAAIGPALGLADGLGAGAPVHVHVAEQAREVEACLAWSGARPVEWLLDHAPVSPRWCLVHATHVTAEEVGRLAASGAVAGLCPTTEANLGDGLFPLPAYLDAGGALAIGSDSHVSVSPVEELRWLEYGQRLVGGTRAVAGGRPHPSPARTLLERAWRGGAAAVGRPVGALAPGHRADFLVLDPDHPALAGREGDARLDGWIFAGPAGAVRETWVGGRRVVEDGRHPAREAVAARYRATLRALGPL